MPAAFRYASIVFALIAIGIAVWGCSTATEIRFRTPTLTVQEVKTNVN